MKKLQKYFFHVAMVAVVVNLTKKSKQARIKERSSFQVLGMKLLFIGLMSGAAFGFN